MCRAGEWSESEEVSGRVGWFGIMGFGTHRVLVMGGRKGLGYG